MDHPSRYCSRRAAEVSWISEIIRTIKIIKNMCRNWGDSSKSV
jgi:hypothetical protein